MPSKKISVTRVDVLDSFRRMAKRLKIVDLEEKVKQAIMVTPGVAALR